MDSKISVAFSDEGIFFNRTAETGEIVQSFLITKYEAINALIPAMADVPAYADKMVADLERQGLARQNHSI